MMRRDVFQAIADPTRRDIMGLLSKQTLTLNGVADNFDMSRPAISKHIKILTQCGLVVIEKKGRERFCKAKPEKLKEVADWVEAYSRFWNDKLNTLKNYIENTL
jgi:DNA-binding transcriptional ArsR family regulator